MNGKRILLIVSGGIAAYKALELVRLLKREGAGVRVVMTAAATEFVTPLSFGVVSEDQVFGDMFDLKEEREIGHIQLSREADLVVVAPATANIIARMAAGHADDLATTILLATDKSVLVVPAMNVRMWLHAATKRNIARLRADGIDIMEPAEGDMACGEYGPGRLPEPPEIVEAIRARLGGRPTPLAGKHAIVTAGPTHEPIDPVRYIANRSSGKQGFAIAGALASLGAEVTLVAGPVSQPTPAGVRRVDVETALEMADAVEAALPAEIAVMVAAVADWRAGSAEQKIKKDGGGAPKLSFVQNPDILAGLARNGRRPKLLIGFAAETENVAENAMAKLKSKGCDWIVANDVSGDVMGGDNNSVNIVTAGGIESWENLSKGAVAMRLAEKIARELGTYECDQLLLRPLARYGDHALLILRLLIGGFLAWEMWFNVSSAATMKLVVGYFAESGFAFPEVFAPLSAWAQFLIGIALILGLCTRWAGELLAFNFVVGVIMVHLDDSFRDQWPALSLLAIGLLLAAQGGGRFALDQRFAKAT